MTDVSAPELRVMDADAFRPFCDAAVAVYAEAMRRGPEVVMQRRAMLERHLGYAGFRAVVALDGDGRVAGFVYTYPGRPGQWWHDSVWSALAAQGGRDHAQDWLGESLEVVELHVRPDRQGRGTGRRLLDAALQSAAGHRTVVLSTHDRESAARALYRSAGFVDLLTDYRFPGGSERFCVMGLRLS